MGQCSNCGEPVPLRKSISGKPLEKEEQDRECPNCGKAVGPEDRSRPHTLSK